MKTKYFFNETKYSYKKVYFYMKMLLYGKYIQKRNMYSYLDYQEVFEYLGVFENLEYDLPENLSSVFLLMAE